MRGSSNSIAKQFFKICEQIERGKLTVVDPAGQIREFGNSDTTSCPDAELHVHDWRMVRSVMMRGDIGLGEAYVEGWWDTPDLEKLSILGMRNDFLIKNVFGGAFLQRILFRLSDVFLRDNNRQGSRQNIRAHYDLGNEFYRLWLDKSMTYSSGIYRCTDETLEQAQNNKYDRLLSRLRDTGPRTLEIGCGWGGFAERAVETSNRDVTAITISDAQYAFARKRLGSRANIRLQDYRDTGGKFDAITSIEMIEAVGQRHWPTYFKTIKDRLAGDGRAIVQAIIVEDNWFDHYRRRSDFIRRYTFPGGMLISPKQIENNAAVAGLKATHFFRFGKDYARTLREWTKRFSTIEPQLRNMGHSNAFLRSWRFYLETCAASFEVGTRTNVVHVELSHA